MDSQLRALNVVDFATLAAASTVVASLADGAPALGANGQVSGRTARRMIITTETAALRWRADGSDAVNVAGSSHVLAINDSLSFTGANYRSLMQNFRCLAAASTCTISITYFE